MRSNFTFEGQKDDEEVILVLHRHPWTLVRPGITILAIWLLVFLIFLIFRASRPTSVALFFAIAFSIVYGLYYWFVWANDLYIITNQRIIRINQMKLFSRRVSEASLSKIQDVTFEVSGMMRTFLNFGTIYIQTAGAQEKVVLEDVEDPYSVQQKIVSAQRLSEERLTRQTEKKILLR